MRPFDALARARPKRWQVFQSRARWEGRLFKCAVLVGREEVPEENEAFWSTGGKERAHGMSGDGCD